MEVFDIIRTTMKEFEKVPNEEINIYIELTKDLVSKRRFGTKYKQAVAYLTAHKMKIAGLGEKVGGYGTMKDTIGISSISEGNTSISFSNNQAGNTSSDAEYALTVYGMQFLQLRRSCIVTIASTGMKYEC